MMHADDGELVTPASESWGPLGQLRC